MSSTIGTPKKETTQSPEIDFGRFWIAALASVGAAVVANLALRALLGATGMLAADFPPFGIAPIALLTAIFTSLGALVFYFIARRSATPVRTYWIVATIAFILSIVPNLLSAANPDAIPFPFPGASPTAFLILIAFHVVAYLTSVLVLTRMAVKR
jgi:hypothetical protein